jgi:hypothetical protein
MRWTVKPSKPVAVFGAIAGVAILVLGITSMSKFTPFLAVWVALGVGIIAFNLWAAFSPRGGVYTVQGSRAPAKTANADGDTSRQE